MKIDQVERAILALVMNDPHSMSIVKPELTPDKFIYGPSTDATVPQKSAHRAIYTAMLQCKSVNVVTVAACLGDQLESVGGEAYLTFLANQFMQQMGIGTAAGLEEWMILVDKSGRLYGLGQIFQEYSKYYDRFAMLVDQVEDVDQFGNDVLQRLTSSLQGSASCGYKHIVNACSDYARRIEDEAGGSILTYFPMGWPSLSKYGLPPQDALFVLSGLSGTGKTQLMLQMGLGVAIQIKYNEIPGNVVFNSYEMSGWRLARRLAACLAGIDYRNPKIRDDASTVYKKVMEALEFINTLPIFFDDTDMTSAQIGIQTARLATFEGSVYFIGVDYAEEVPDEYQGSEELRVSRIFRNMKAISRSTGSCACLLSQVSDVSSFRNGIVPYNRLRYSRAGTNAADIIAYVYNPPQMRAMQIPFTFEEKMGDPEMAYLVVQKYRDGKVGAIPLEWEAKHVRFSDPLLKKFGSKSMLYRNIDDIGYVDGRFLGDEF